MLVEQIRADQLQARKDKDGVAKDLLTTVLGEIESKSKRPDIRPGFELGIIKSFLNNAQAFMEQLAKQGAQDGEKYTTLARECQILEAYLPKMASREDLTAAIKEVIPGETITPKDKGVLMAALKARFGQTLDAAEAMKICKELFGI